MPSACASSPAATPCRSRAPTSRSSRPSASSSSCGRCSRQQGKLSREDVRTRPGRRAAGRRTATARRTWPSIEGSRHVRPRTDGQARYVQAMRDNDLIFCIGPAGTGKTYLAVGMAVNLLRQNAVKQDRPGPARGRGRRTARLPARRHRGQDQSLPAAAVRRPQRHDGPGAGQALHGERHHRDRAAGLHARPNAEPARSSFSTKARTRPCRR